MRKTYVTSGTLESATIRVFNDPHFLATLPKSNLGDNLAKDSYSESLPTMLAFITENRARFEYFCGFLSKEEIIDIIKPFNQKSPSSTLTDSDKVYQVALHLLAFCKPDPNLVEHWREELTKYELSRGNQITFEVQRISAFNFFVGNYAPSLRNLIGYKGVDALGDFVIIAFIFTLSAQLWSTGVLQDFWAK